MLADGPKHGYRLKQDAAIILGQGELHNNLVYPLLRRFTANKWVTKERVPGERGQTRQQYAITALGRKALLERIRDFGEQDVRSADAFRARVGFFEMLTADERELILHVREEFLRPRDERLARLQESMNLGTYGAEVVSFMREQIASELAWIERLRRLHPTKR
jgi:DNA-binding PadR family transcriptional regulator